MTPRRPPVLAQTLLEWVDPANDALHGDLLEEFASGRSRLWYWNQVFAAAGVAFDYHAQLKRLAPFIFLRAKAVEQSIPRIGCVT